MACGTGRGGGLLLLSEPFLLARVVRVGPPAGVAALRRTGEMRGRRARAAARARLLLGVGVVRGRGAEGRGRGHVRRVRVVAHAAVERGERRVEVVLRARLWRVGQTARAPAATPVAVPVIVIAVVIAVIGGGRRKRKVGGEGRGGGGGGAVVLMLMLGRVRRADVKDVVGVRWGPVAIPVPVVAAAACAVVGAGLGALGAALVALGVDEAGELVVKVHAGGVEAVAHEEVGVGGRGVVGGGRGREMEALLADVGLVGREREGGGGGRHKYSVQAVPSNPISVSIRSAHGQGESGVLPA
ncbi:hypothetical protein C8R44DRAFT_749000 [Mycena epipterygia]|nr:hypothetical protein C8R44DRAFT_749000 [Mycena epipterygia]